MANMPGLTDERVTLDLLKNHGQLKATLVLLTMHSDLRVLDSYVATVAGKWFDLGRLHLHEASALDVVASPRAAYSRAYYAAYNASKAVRYVVRGSVSLKGDDHKKVADLPDSFPDVDSWASRLPLLYEHRLRADYDNWTNTPSENVLLPVDCVNLARQFIAVAESFLFSEYGLRL